MQLSTMKFLVISTFILHLCATKLSTRENFRPIAARHGGLSPKEMKLFRLMLAKKRKYKDIPVEKHISSSSENDCYIFSKERILLFCIIFLQF